MKDFQLGKFKINNDSPVVIIAELACEHGGKIDAAKRLIKAAKEVGADIVKLQMHVIEEEMVPNSIKFWAGSMDEVLGRVNIGTAEQHRELKKYCEALGIMYLCTPFCREAADILEQVGVEAYKTGSGELTNLPMQRHIAKKGKPMIVSTGMSTLTEVAETVKALNEEGASFALTHCVSEYPADYRDLSLGVIDILKKKFGVVVGYSDHTREIYSAIAAVAKGAKIIEKHLTIRDLRGPDDNVSLDPEQFKEMVEAIRKIEKSLGSRKLVHDREKEIRSWAHHSVVVRQAIPAGTKITPEMLTVKRPGWGVAAKFLPDFIGKKAKKDLKINELIKWEDIK